MRTIAPTLPILALAVLFGATGCDDEVVAYAGPRTVIEGFEVRDMKCHYSIGRISNRDEATNTRAVLEIWRLDDLRHEIQVSETWGPGGMGTAEHRVTSRTRTGKDGQALPTWVANGDRVRLRTETWIGKDTRESGRVNVGIREYSDWITLARPATRP